MCIDYYFYFKKSTTSATQIYKNKGDGVMIETVVPSPATIRKMRTLHVLHNSKGNKPSKLLSIQ
jgi:hypothetical protein